ncbi:MAG: DUF21 domain-containing protein [Planctomycetaceae bacterium]|nr:DUF21 domain-containing protein [Planctomycetaceae bacterium]
MTEFVTMFVALLIFFLGLRLSGFFSGSETGFYRVSTLQVTLQKQRGETIGTRLFYFVSHPERFVATTLVGNNVANYLTTLAIGLLVHAIWVDSTGLQEIIATLMMTPVVFIFGELIPKSLYYRAPMMLLRNGSLGFMVCYYLFFPISYPLILVSRFVSRFSTSDKRPLEVVFGRTRLYGVLEAGQKEGILTGLQRDLAENLMQVAEDPVSLAMIPPSIVVGAPSTASLDQMRAVARRTESAFVMLSEGGPYNWTSYARMSDVLANGVASQIARRTMLEFDATTPRIEVLTQMMKQQAVFGRVVSNGQLVGIIRRQTLISQLFRVIRPASS